MPRLLASIASVVMLGVACVLGRGPEHWAAGRSAEEVAAWREVAPGVWRSGGLPAAHALVADRHALVFDLPDAALLDALGEEGVEQIDGVWLTHHHRDTAGGAVEAARGGTRVRAAAAAAELLTLQGVRRRWEEEIPQPTSQAAYFVLAEGIEGIDATLEPGQSHAWRGWQIEVIDAAGHTPSHVAFAARRLGAAEAREPVYLFCGDALAAPGRMHAPFTLDHDHWTSGGLDMQAETLRRLQQRRVTWLGPAHGEALGGDAVEEALASTLAAVEEAAFLKSFERYSRERLGGAPEYAFLAPDNVAAGYDRPWTRLSEHLFVLANTYALVSDERDLEGRRALLVVDPFGEASIARLGDLREEYALGEIEVVLITHAHFDHYDGVFSLPDREAVAVWTLDRTVCVLEDPRRYWAPWLVDREMEIDRSLAAGEDVRWREYRFRVHHFPGQTDFTMALETEIDGRRCVFTADNFFHADQFSGSGGWMGLNRALPAGYARSAQIVLEIAPDWVLAEHGGPFEFNAEDFRRRLAWAQDAQRACDALCLSGSASRDWNPHVVRFDPLVVAARPGGMVEVVLIAENPRDEQERLRISLEGRNLIGDFERALDLPAGATSRERVEIAVSPDVPGGRHVFPLRVSSGGPPSSADAFLVLDVAGR